MHTINISSFCWKQVAIDIMLPNLPCPRIVDGNFFTIGQQGVTVCGEILSLGLSAKSKPDGVRNAGKTWESD